MAEKDALTEQVPQEELNQEPETSDIINMETLLEQEGLGLDLPHKGETRTGVIASVSDNEVLVSVGAKSEGVIYSRELEKLSEEERASLEVGKEIPVYIVTTEDRSGNLMLSYTRAKEEMDWKLAEELMKSGESYSSTIIGYNKGGLLVSLGKLQGFVPASQVSLKRRANVTGDTPDQRWGSMVDETIEVCVIEVDHDRHRLILSEKAAIQETRETLKDRLLDELKTGDIRTGRVTNLADFGAFVNIEGADGLVHISEISWEHIEHPKEVLNIGQEVQVKVINVDHEKKRIGLSLRQLQDDPWIKKVEHLRVGQLVEGTITHLTKFGAFANFGEDELEGLIHISELSDKRIAHPKEIISEGDVCTLRIINIDQERRRIGLSLRKVDSAAYSDLDWKLLGDEIEEVKDLVISEDGGIEVREAEEDSQITAKESEEEIGEAEAPEAGDQGEESEPKVSEEPEVEIETTAKESEEEMGEAEAPLAEVQGEEGEPEISEEPEVENLDTDEKASEEPQPDAPDPEEESPPEEVPEAKSPEEVTS
ncbi:MAG: S1 RNA-binding domain-containing protein [Anaerolineales bacterium]|nr:S1 RNA-binding domain-containing protein [Anaerolineales bacterium]